jgi:hypothetical protein
MRRLKGRLRKNLHNVSSLLNHSSCNHEDNNLKIINYFDIYIYIHISKQIFNTYFHSCKFRAHVQKKNYFGSVSDEDFGSLKADSHIICRAHAVPLRVQNVSFLFDLHSAAVSDSHLPCQAYAMLRPCRSSQSHGTARPSRDGLWATCPRSASSGYHEEFQEGCYQKHTNLRCRWPVWNQTTFVMNEEKSGSSTLQKRRSVNTFLSDTLKLD